MKRLLLVLLRVYKIALSPYVGSQCRFLPTCSDYARDAVIAHGAARGSWLAACRLCRCHPLANGGLDPVPPVNQPSAPAAHGRIRLPRP